MTPIVESITGITINNSPYAPVMVAFELLFAFLIIYTFLNVLLYIFKLKR